MFRVVFVPWSTGSNLRWTSIFRLVQVHPLVIFCCPTTLLNSSIIQFVLLVQSCSSEVFVCMATLWSSTPVSLVEAMITARHPSDPLPGVEKCVFCRVQVRPFCAALPIRDPSETLVLRLLLHVSSDPDLRASVRRKSGSSAVWAPCFLRED